ncbi:unnamed protein product [Didymodactylos carnosus]|uniref:Uncharacterized protein n=1 Tax=Didymodactylos carnosus TaxID=1234261 RepID=A0A815FTB1_9BILA|nr:unnamed protein product [Didymodactylos carnosus]CAF1328603.1 unnamed protein product [Didymodactylos carnosus]CAF3832027.1 unnamed protein product [Didymodactylos carnosus]CAF4180471.1 unnamed protein product [Didymodactylos carnosus]
MTNEDEQKREFSEDFQTIMAVAKEVQPRVNVETEVSRVYENHGFAREFDFKAKYSERKAARFSHELSKPSYAGINRFFCRSKEDQFWNELHADVSGVLEQVRVYSSHIPQQAITQTEDYLRQYKHHKTDSMRTRAHQHVYAMLVEHLTPKQKKWETNNNIPAQLSIARNNL